MTLYLLSYNNYYDRVIKTEPTLEDYDDYVIYTIPNANFHVADGINTTHIVGGPNIYDGSANYLIVADNGIIHSRWFIIENDKTRGGQYNLTLHRDVVSDYYNSAVNAPCFIEKATLDNNNPLIFNQEDMTFNQIKKYEKFLKDGTNCPWIVGYFSKDWATEAKTITIPMSDTQSYTTYSSESEIPYYNNIRSGTFKGEVNSRIGIRFKAFYNAIVYINYYKFTFYSDKSYNYNNFEPTGPFERDIRVKETPNAENISEAASYFANGILGDLEWFNAVTDEANSKDRTEDFLRTWPVSGKVIRVGTPTSGYKYYKVTRSNVITDWEVTYDADPGTVAYTKAVENLEANDLFDVIRDATITYNYHYNRYSISMEELEDPTSYTVTIPANENRTHLNDSPYDMFAIPYGDTLAEFDNGNFRFFPSADIGFQTANEIALAMGGTTSNVLFDLQLLPYCPIPDLASYPYSALIDARRLTAKDYTFVQSEGTVKSVIFFPQKSDFSFTISKIFHKGLDGWEDPGIDITEPKVQALCDTYRIVSPNYNGQFEFNAAKNGGVRYYEVDCTYKPYSPYIHVCPNFGGLYGKDFNDARGLVCGGDFSLPTITDQWITYEINNKNYLNTFNRQIENMEVNNKYQRQREVIGAVAGAVGTGLSTGVQSGMLTGSTGAGIGIGLATGAVSAGAAMYDISVNDKLRAEAIDYTKDQFGYQLGNIQALPYSLNRVSAFNINNKVFPIVEYYTCTDIEKQALRDKVKYNGMTVMVIGAIADYIRPEKSYIKGQIIRFDDNDLDDFHIAAAISDEINKGVFI